MSNIKINQEYQRKIAAVLLVAFVVALFLRVFVVEGYVVDGVSMLPTLEPGDYVFVYKQAYLRKDPQRGEVVVAKPRQHKIKVIKRVAVLPLEKYEIEGERVNKLDPGEYYLLGDNGSESFDSQDFGPVDRWDIKGKAFIGFRLKSFKLITF